MKIKPLSPPQTEPLGGFNDFTVHEVRPRSRSNAWAPFASSLCAAIFFLVTLATVLAAVLACVVVGAAIKKMGL